MMTLKFATNYIRFMILGGIIFPKHVISRLYSYNQPLTFPQKVGETIRIPRRWFQILLIFTPTLGKGSNLTSIFFNGVETTN